MALSSILSRDSLGLFGSDAGSVGAGFSDGRTGLGFSSVSGDGLSFDIRAPLYTDDKAAPESKIEFLHGTTTLAFKVSSIIHPQSLGPRTPT